MESGPKGWIETATKKSVGMQKKVQILKLNQVQNFYKRQKKKKKSYVYGSFENHI